MKKITIDLDGSVDPTHGMQQLALFNGHYDRHCYFPLSGFLLFNEETENYLFAAMLRIGTSPEKAGSLAPLKSIMPYLKERFPRARLFVRFDAGFKGPELLNLLDESGVSYAVGLSSNSVLKAASAGLVGKVQSQSENAGKTVTRYSESMYAASSLWRKARRVICKAEYLQTYFPHVSLAISPNWRRSFVRVLP